MKSAPVKVVEVTREELLARKAWLEEQQEIRFNLSDYDIYCELSEIDFLLGES